MELGFLDTSCNTSLYNIVLLLLLLLLLMMIALFDKALLPMLRWCMRRQCVSLGYVPLISLGASIALFHNTTMVMMLTMIRIMVMMVILSDTALPIVFRWCARRQSVFWGCVHLMCS